MDENIKLCPEIKVGEGEFKTVKVKDMNLNKDVSLFKILKYTNLWYKITSIPRFIKFAWQRIRYGVSEYDAWGSYVYFQQVMENSLKILRATKQGHPCKITEQEWDDYLKDLIKNLEFTNSEACMIPYECYEDMKDKYGAEDERTKRLLKEWLDYEAGFEERQHEAVEYVLENMKTYWEHLWD